MKERSVTGNDLCSECPEQVGFECTYDQGGKVKVKVKFTLEQTVKAQRGSRGI
jgi:hypothetical protein